MPIFNGYRYAPLPHKDSIRLAILYPSTDETVPLQCQIVDRRLSEPRLDYSAVSYAWGDPKALENIEIECDGDVGYLRITTNASIVLKGLRKRTEPRYLWIDTICVNQNDKAETAHQIPVMGDIYRKAVEVVIWLGLEDYMTTMVLAFFRKLSRLPDVKKWRAQEEVADCIFNLMKKSIHRHPLEALQAIYDFFQQPWFSRRWIVQEACLAQHGVVRCGKRSIDLHSLSLAATRFQALDLADNRIKVAATLGQHTIGLSMFELLWHFHDSECKQEKDRIAAFLGLAGDVRDLRLDYKKPWEGIFRDLARFALNSGDNDNKLRLLFHLSEFGPVSKGNDRSYPSWVPNWSRSRKRILPYIHGPRNSGTDEPYPSFVGLSGKATVAFERDCLQIRGSLFGIGTKCFGVVSVAALDSHQCAEDFSKHHVRCVIERLFPCISCAELRIEALAALLAKVSQFRHPQAEREETSKPLGRFEEALRRHFPSSLQQVLLAELRTLESVLRDFCLVELKAPGSNLTTYQGFGISSELISVDDILIPLWSLPVHTFGYEFRHSVDPTGQKFRFSTMLAVRRSCAELRDNLGEAIPIQECRIIGPVVCVTWSRAPRDGENPLDLELFIF